MLLHILVVVVQSANGKVASGSEIYGARHHDTLASTTARGTHSYLFARLGDVQIHAPRVLVLKTASTLIHIDIVEKVCSIGLLTQIAVYSQQTIHVQLWNWVIATIVVRVAAPSSLVLVIGYWALVLLGLLLQLSVLHVLLEFLQTIDLVLNVTGCLHLVFTLRRNSLHILSHSLLLSFMLSLYWLIRIHLAIVGLDLA